jgi:hypothetical protein
MLRVACRLVAAAGQLAVAGLATVETGKRTQLERTGKRDYESAAVNMTGSLVLSSK